MGAGLSPEQASDIDDLKRRLAGINAQIEQVQRHGYTQKTNPKKSHWRALHQTVKRAQARDPTRWNDEYRHQLPSQQQSQKYH
jgi:hypothetical protein